MGAPAMPGVPTHTLERHPLQRLAASLKNSPCSFFGFLPFLGTILTEGKEERDLASLGTKVGKMGEGLPKKKEEEGLLPGPQGSFLAGHHPEPKLLAPVPWRGGAV